MFGFGIWEFLIRIMAKASINGPFSIAMLVYQRVCVLYCIWIKSPLNHHGSWCLHDLVHGSMQQGLDSWTRNGFLFSRGDDYQNQSGSETICVLYIHCIILYNIYVYNMYSINSI